MPTMYMANGRMHMHQLPCSKSHKPQPIESGLTYTINIILHARHIVGKQSYDVVKEYSARIAT